MAKPLSCFITNTCSHLETIYEEQKILHRFVFIKVYIIRAINLHKCPLAKGGGKQKEKQSKAILYLFIRR